jgi:hypothetical protein
MNAAARSQRRLALHLTPLNESRSKAKAKESGLAIRAAGRPG